MACYTLQLREIVISMVVWRLAIGLSYRANEEICDLHGSVPAGGRLAIPCK